VIFYLKSDVNSYNHKNYAKKGDQVKVIAEFGHVMVVELISNQNRFSVKESLLSKEKIEKDDTAGDNGMASRRPVSKGRRSR
jgi:hypothetical protein